jgi:hypothetical protein
MWEAGRIVLLPLASIVGFAAFVFAARWLARQSNPSGLLKFAERVRRALAYEDDPPADCR